MNYFVSVIIPIFNSAPYLRECVESVLSQTYKNIEIILVDDGSTDESPAICDEYKSKDSRVKVIHQQNGGLSIARNNGLEFSTGEFVLFLDSDDFWRSKSDLEKLMSNPCIYSSDFVYLEFNRSRYIPSLNKFVDLPQFADSLSNPIDNSAVCCDLIKNGIFPMSACTKLLNRRFLDENNVRFIKGLFSEDVPWFMDLLLKAKKGAFYTNQYMYGNRSEVSTSLTSVFSTKKFKDVIDIFDLEIPKIQAADISDEAKESLLSFFAYRYIVLMTQVHRHKKQIGSELVNRYLNYSWVLKFDRHPKVKKTNKLIKLFGKRIATVVLVYYISNRDKLKASGIKKIAGI